jgi:hypothetical protein
MVQTTFASRKLSGQRTALSLIIKGLMIMTQHEFQVADNAAVEPAALIGAAADSSHDTRDTGLILTKDDIKNLRKYEIAGLALPTALNDVITYLGYETGAGRELEAVDFQKTFELIHGHASLWNPLRNDLLTVNDQLVMFAGLMQVYGESIIEVLDGIRALTLAEEHDIKSLEELRQLESQWGHKFPEIHPVDREDLGAYLDDILKQVRVQEAEAQNIKKRLDAFGFDLPNKVGAAISLKLSAINKNTLGVEVKALQTAIDERAAEIERRNKEYDHLVKEAISSIAGGGGLIMMIYSSVKAEDVRTKRNDLRATQERDIQAMDKKNSILGSLNRVRNDLQNLGIVVLDADIATKNLITMWNGLNTFISQSSRAINDINDALLLRRFSHQFKLVVRPWKNIEVDAQKLRDVFAAADREIQEEWKSA